MDSVEWLVIDDGSTDRTVEVAREHGVDHIVRLTNNRGPRRRLPVRARRLPQARRRRDRQHRRRQPVPGRRRVRLGRADRGRQGRHGDRRPADRHDRALLAGQEVAPALRQRGRPARLRAPTSPDTTSGFRAYNREAALQLQVVSKFTYTLESLIQAGKMLVAVEHVPVRTNEQTRPSRLFPSMWSYVRRNGISIFRIYALYEPLRVFVAAAAAVALVGAVIWVRFAWFFLEGEGDGHIQSLILGATLFIVAVQLLALGVVGDILAGSRVLQQRILERVRRVELQLGVEPSHYEPGATQGEREATTGAQPARPPASRHPGPTDPPARRSSCERRRRGPERGRPHREHLRQVRVHEPGGQAADGRLPRAASTSSGRAPRPSRCSTWAAARACSPSSGRSASATGAWWASTSTTRSWRAEWEQRQRAEPRVPDRGRHRALVRRRRVRHGHRDRGARARARPGGHAGRDGARGAPPAARVGAARAALARAQRGARRLPGRARQHARAT